MTRLQSVCPWSRDATPTNPDRRPEVRYVYRHTAFVGPESIGAAAASECAANQGKFWEFHDTLFAHTAGRNAGVFTRTRLKQYGASLGLDRTTFVSCVDSGRYESCVQRETDLGRQKGVTSTRRCSSTARRFARPAVRHSARVDRQRRTARQLRYSRNAQSMWRGDRQSAVVAEHPTLLAPAVDTTIVYSLRISAIWVSSACSSAA